jgi:hypothetical protein
LKELEARNGTRILNLAKGESKKPECKCDNGGPRFVPGNTADASIAIACGDGRGLNDTPEELYKRYQWMLQEFGTFADLWIHASGRCTYVARVVLKFQTSFNLLNRGWRVRAPERFLGPVLTIHDNLALLLS